MKFISFLLLTTLTFEAFAQTIKEPVTGTGGVGDLLNPAAPTTTTGPLPTPTAFPGCPFTLDIDELVPPDVENEFKNLHTRLTASQDPACRSEGESIGNLLSLLGIGGRGQGSGQPQTPPGPGAGSGDIDLGSLGAGSGKGGDVVSPPPVTQPPRTSPGENCRTNPARCEALITQILENARTKQACYGGNAVDTVLGMAFRIGTPVVGQIALGVSVVRSIIGLFRSRRTDAQTDMNQFFTQEVPKRQMDTLQACYAPQLFQDVNCRQSYLNCLTSDAQTADQSGFCAGGFGRLSQSSGGSGNEGSACQRYRAWADPRSPDSLTREITFNGASVSKLSLLEMCIRDRDGNAEKSGDDFLIETNVMSEIYACMSYWSKAKKESQSNRPLTDRDLNDIRSRCTAGKKTKGRADVSPWIIEYNKLRMAAGAENTQFVRTELLPDVMRLAQRFHRDQIQRATYQDEVAIQSAVNHCFYGYGIDMALGRLRNQTYEQGNNSIPDRCQAINSCTQRIVDSIRPSITFPAPPAPLSGSVRPMQSLNQMYLSEEPGRRDYKSNMPSICYGMAMNQLVDHASITFGLSQRGFNGRAESCTRTPPSPSYLDSEDASAQ